MNSNEKFVLVVLCKTWSRDSHGLFDYEALQIKTNTYYCLKPMTAIRRKHEVKLVETESGNPEEQFLFKILLNNGNFK